MNHVIDRPTIGSLLRQWRTRRHMSQLDLALEAGVSELSIEPFFCADAATADRLRALAGC